jgi:5'-methylthioadenosine phosphorylase
MTAIGVIGGSGFYSLFEKKDDEVWPENIYGRTSSSIVIGSVGMQKVAFLARHGKGHEIPPHKVPYRANILALKDLGVAHIMSASVAISLRPEIKTGEFVIPNQFVNFTQRRGDSFYDGPEIVHIDSADPFCFHLREILVAKCKSAGLSVHPNGTAVVIQGPRLPTKAENSFYKNQGWDIVGMTMYPEMVLARELGLCYSDISLVTDYSAEVKIDDAINASTGAVACNDVANKFTESMEKLKQLVLSAVSDIPDERTCECRHALDGARVQR